MSSEIISLHSVWLVGPPCLNWHWHTTTFSENYLTNTRNSSSFFYWVIPCKKDFLLQKYFNIKWWRKEFISWEKNALLSEVITKLLRKFNTALTKPSCNFILYDNVAGRCLYFTKTSKKEFSFKSTTHFIWLVVMIGHLTKTMACWH